MKPLLYLDVDGVLNAIRGPLKDEEVFECMGYQILRCEAYKDPRFLDLFEQFEVHWATTWAENAPKFIAPKFQIPECAVLETVFRPNINQKFEALLAHAKERPFVWVDDDAKYALEARNICKQRSEHCLIVSPATGLGLTSAHLDQIFSFPDNCYYLSEREESGRIFKTYMDYKV